MKEKFLRKLEDFSCPNCGHPGMNIFYELDQVPVHSVLLLAEREEALNYAKGSIHLGLCESCGFISNTAFQPEVHEYSSRYEATQGYSPTFNTFHKRLASMVVDRYGLHGKKLIEIGCGDGEFLSLLCSIGGNHGVGFDPAYSPERSMVKPSDHVEFIQDFYSEKYTHYKADFICCKMTLEHIHNTGEFIGIVRRSIGSQLDSTIFFQVPNGSHVFGETAFWDIYYEHCSYFSKGSLARLFRGAGFEVTDLWTDYDNQYLMIRAQPCEQNSLSPLPQEESPEEMTRLVEEFVMRSQGNIQRWKDLLEQVKTQGKKIVLWGGGSKGVAFLTTLEIYPEIIEYVVDVNPHKAGTYMAGTGQNIVLPAFLARYQPDTVVVMNPVYMAEVRNQLDSMGLHPELLPISVI